MRYATGSCTAGKRPSCMLCFTVRVVAARSGGAHMPVSAGSRKMASLVATQRTAACFLMSRTPPHAPPVVLPGWCSAARRNLWTDGLGCCGDPPPAQPAGARAPSFAPSQGRAMSAQQSYRIASGVHPASRGKGGLAVASGNAAQLKAGPAGAWCPGTGRSTSTRVSWALAQGCLGPC